VLDADASCTVGLARDCMAGVAPLCRQAVAGRRAHGEKLTGSFVWVIHVLCAAKKQHLVDTSRRYQPGEYEGYVTKYAGHPPNLALAPSRGLEP
jgi:hypothetical protein